MNSLTIGWWNSGVSPIRGKSKVSKSEILAPLMYVCQKSEIVFLAEQTEGDLPLGMVNGILRHFSTGKNFLSVDLSYKSGNSGFKMVMLYDSAFVQVTRLPRAKCEFLETIGHTNDEHYRVGLLVRVKTSLIKEFIDIFLVHWSQYSETDSLSVKFSAASTIAAKMYESATSYKLCIGDFNVEPYASPLSELGASRSLTYVYSGNAIFYNPLWKFMPYCGSINSSGDRAMKCFEPLFDQVLIGRQFILDGFSEELTLLGDDGFRPPNGGHRPLILKLLKRK